MTSQRRGAEPEAEPMAAGSFSTASGILALWFAVLAGPIAWAMNQELSYLFVPWACATGTRLMLHVVTIAALLLSLAGSVVGWQSWRKSGDSDDAAGSAIGRSRFMALGGMTLSVMFAVVILAQGFPSFLLSPCQ